MKCHIAEAGGKSSDELLAGHLDPWARGVQSPFDFCKRGALTPRSCASPSPYEPAGEEALRLPQSTKTLSCSGNTQVSCLQAVHKSQGHLQ